jgi:phage baseplate assembly protein W
MLTYTLDHPATATELRQVAAEDLAAEVFGVDIFFDNDVDHDAGGDYLQVEGWAALRAQLRFVLALPPGQYAVDPTIGCGLRAFVKEPDSQANRALIEQRCRDQVNPARFPAVEKLVDVAIARSASGKVLEVTLIVEALGKLRKVTASFSEEAV